MKLLDLFCGAGGAAMGYWEAGFDTIVGVDTEYQPNYPFRFIQADVLEEQALIDVGWDLIHASPPCQAYSIGSIGPRSEGKTYPRLVEPVLEMLEGTHYVVENVVGAPLRADLMLCGSMFGLRAKDPDLKRTVYLKRHRVFQTSFAVEQPEDRCFQHSDAIAGVYGGGGQARQLALEGKPRRGGYTPRADVRRELMEASWMTQREVNEAIPPAYTRWIGERFIEQVFGSEKLRVNLLEPPTTQYIH